MARRDGPVDDRGALREYLTTEATEFRRRMIDICLADQAMAECAWRELSKAVDALAGSGAHMVLRSELPDWHPSRVDGGPNDLLVLDADDRLMLYADAKTAP
jgi:hypothetical protein